MSTSSKTDGSAGKTSPSPPPPPIQYCYMFESNKSPSTQLDALLRAISSHIIREIGDKCVLFLSPQKLAAFYKAVGGDYDSLFVSMPDSAISYMWQVTGCQHSLQPTDNDFAAPSIPALTSRGFSRWESLEILLGPEEHVPFLQYAVKNWNLKHPETGQAFPADLPKSVFPTEADAEVDLWHKACAEKLRDDVGDRQRETPKAASANAPGPGQAPGQAPDHPKFAYSHVRGSFQNTRARPGEPPHAERSVPFNHVPGRPGGGSRREPERHYEESRFDEQGRRKSFSDYSMPPRNEKAPYSQKAPYLDPNANTKRPPTTRRHSQPRHVSESSEGEEMPPPRSRRPPERSPPKSPPRRHPSTSDTQSGADGRSAQGYRPHRSEMKSDDLRRRSGHSPSLREKVTDKVSNLFANGSTPQERPRSSPRPSYSDASRPRRSRDRPPPSRLNQSYSDLDSENSSDIGDSEDEAAYRAKKAREEREKERRYRERERGREREEDRRDRAYLRRPNPERRTSSHADMDRRRDSQTQWDPRTNPRDDRRRWDRRMAEEERDGSPTMGVGGRRYPEAAYS